ncbi:MAG: hypothetical protein QOK48_1527 [Blastocatellia bacterium]|nr:hypothetical protein [Blastocatellia bacterium]
MKADQTLFTPAVTHLPENITDGDMDVLLIELKTPKPKTSGEKTC